MTTPWVVNGHEMQHFTLDEFRCPCCYRKPMDPHALVTFDRVRDRAKIPMVVTSGYRCPAHNAKINGATNSSHLRALAGDFATPTSTHRYRILEAAIAVGVNRIGIGDTFIHLDVDRSLPQCVIWTYGEAA